MVGSTCDKCTMTVPAAANTCGMCFSWRCDGCEFYSRSAAATCEVCTKPRPAPRFAAPQGALAKTAPAAPGHNQPQWSAVPRPAPTAIDPSAYPASLAIPPAGAPAAAMTLRPVAPPSPTPQGALVSRGSDVACSRCTFLNRSASRSCELCDSPLPTVGGGAITPLLGPPSPASSASYASPTAPGAQAHVAPGAQPPVEATPGAQRLMSRQSTVLVRDDDFHATINEARSLCRTARTPFVAMMNAIEHGSLEWGSIFNELRPGVPNVGAMVSRNDAFIRSLTQLVTVAVVRPQWRVFPEHGISADDIAQGELGDCWFLSAVAVLAHSRPRLIEDLFIVKDVNPEGVFAVRLWRDGTWAPFLVDGNFPTLYGGKLFRFARCKRNDALWVPLLEKAYAMMHGSYQAIASGQLDEAFYDLTGLPCEKIKLCGPGDDGLERVLVDTDDTFARMASMRSGQCTLGASCGCTPFSLDNARRINLQVQHAYSVLEVAVDAPTRSRLVRLRNPWGREAYAGVAPPCDGVTHAPMNGSFWMPFDLFLRCFSDMVVCYTRDFAGGVSAAPRCHPSSGYFPPLRRPPEVPESQAPTSVALHVAAPTTIRVMAVQPKLRGEQAQNAGYFDVALFILKIEEDGRARFIASSVGVCDRVVNFERMMDPGLYAVMPFSLQQHQARNPQLTLNVLSESDRVAQLAWDDVVPPRLMLNRMLYEFLAVDAAHLDQRAASSCWHARSWRRGTTRFELIESASRHPSECVIDASTTRGAEVVPAIQRQVQLPPRGAAIALVSSVLAHRGSYELQYGHQWTMKETPLRVGIPADPAFASIFEPFAR